MYSKGLEYVDIFFQRYNKYTGIYSFARNDGLTLKFFRIFHQFFPFKKYLVYLLSVSFGWTPDEIDPVSLESPKYLG
jgi:hypothetical protein